MTREEAIKWFRRNPFYHKDHKPFNMAIKALEQEPKTGHWIPLGNYDDWGNERSYKCSECGDVDTYPDNYCPNCGVRMVETQESEG